jgi:hypothetical protein
MAALTSNNLFRADKVTATSISQEPNLENPPLDGIGGKAFYDVFDNTVLRMSKAYILRFESRLERQLSSNSITSDSSSIGIA